MTKLILKSGFGGKKGFTLPEVIISFSVLILVITSATGILVTVMRSNADNVRSLVAYGLAQEGIEAARMIRDTDALLGLDFDGSKGVKTPPWAGKLFESGSTSTSEFVLLRKSDLSACNPNVKAEQISGCLPYEIVAIANVKTDLSAVVFKKNSLEEGGGTDGGSGGGSGSSSGAGSPGAMFVQTKDGTADGDFVDSGFRRYLRVEPIMSVSGGVVDVMRVSSVVSWLSNNGNERKLVLTTDLTNWK